jgi:hypothetical protein
MMSEPIRVLHPEIKSIQGERQAAEADGRYMEDADVERYVDSQSPGVVTCRERGRHDPPTIRETGLHFVDVSEYGLHIRRVRCRSCQLVDIIEEWDVRHRNGVVTRAERVSARPDYSVRGPNGEKYLAPQGHGKMTPKMVKNAVGTGQLKGQSFKEIRKEIRSAQEHREGRVR